MSNVTPRKRKATAIESPTATPKRSSRLAPNPPLAPFPTPPSTRHRLTHADLPPPPPQPDFSLGSMTPPESSSTKVQAPTPLPPSLQGLLNLHNAFNLALSLHLATHPPVLPPHSPEATRLDLPNLTNFLAMRETVERTSGRRFGLPELGRLAWVWSWDGKALPGDKPVKADENPFLVADEKSTSDIRVCGLTYLITPTRTLENGGRKVHTYGVGIELDLKPGETRQILVGGNEGGLSNRGQGGGMAAVGRWNAGQEQREDEFRARLDRWVELHGGYEAPEPSLLPTPQTSGSSRSSIPPIPLLPLPHLGPASVSSGNLFASSSTLGPAPSLTSMPKKPVLDDPFVLNDQAESSKGKVVRTGSVEQRKQAMMDRIKARKNGGAATLGSSVGQSSLDKIRPAMSVAEQQEALKKRSTLSRLEGIAEAVWMMFSGPSPGASTLPTPPRGRRKAIPLAEVADVIVKSSKTPTSTAEAETSLRMLTELCPFFLTVKTVARKEWLEMPAAVAVSPMASPGASAASARLMSALESSPSTPTKVTPNADGLSRLPEAPGSPTPGSRKLSFGAALGPPISPSSSSRATRQDVRDVPEGRADRSTDVFATPVRRMGEMAGPASPGRVRRVGGLREVRERIRRALGE